MDSENEESSISLNLPVPEDAFRYKSAGQILNLLSTYPHEHLSLSDLQSSVEASPGNVKNGVDLLEQLGVVESTYEDSERRVQIKHEVLSKPDDPLLRIPQAEFRRPVKAFLNDLFTKVEADFVTVILFGSVARGEADRRSDIDLWIAVDEDSRAKVLREVHREVRAPLEDQRFEGDRYEFHVLMESVESAISFRNEIDEILREGIVLYKTETFDEIREAVFSSNYSSS